MRIRSREPRQRRDRARLALAQVVEHGRRQQLIARVDRLQVAQAARVAEPCGKVARSASVALARNGVAWVYHGVDEIVVERIADESPEPLGLNVFCRSAQKILKRAEDVGCFLNRRSRDARSIGKVFLLLVIEQRLSDVCGAGADRAHGRKRGVGRIARDFAELAYARVKRRRRRNGRRRRARGFSLIVEERVECVSHDDRTPRL